MKNYVSYDFKRGEPNLSSQRNQPPEYNNNNNNEASPLHNMTHSSCSSPDLYESRIIKLENKIRELEHNLQFFNDYFKLSTLFSNSIHQHEELLNDVFSKIVSIENQIMNIQTNQNQFNIDNVIEEKLTSIKMSVNQNINEIKFVFSEINQCNLRQDNEFANLKEQIDKMKQYNEFVNIQEQINKINKIIEDKEHNIKDIETKIQEMDKKINNINNERAEETFLKNIRTKH